MLCTPIFEKDGHPSLFVRRQRLGYDDRPRFNLYHFSKDGQISKPIEIHLPLPEDPEKKNYRHSFDPNIYGGKRLPRHRRRVRALENRMGEG